MSHADQTSLLPDSIAGLPDGLARMLFGLTRANHPFGVLDALLGFADLERGRGDIPGSSRRQAALP